MKCPFCKNTLKAHSDEHYICPVGHGTLLSSSILNDIEELSITDTTSAGKTRLQHQPISCPKCSKVMQIVDFNSTNILIDACTKCHSRWLDAGEVHKIKTHKPDIKPADLLFLAKVDAEIKKASNYVVEEANPRLPLQGSYRAGSEVVSLWSNNSRVRLGSIAGQGLFGIVKGLMHSKTSRYLTLLTLAVFALLFYFVIIDSKNTFSSL